jgi:Leucine-rich repeat (LRR) protein
MASCVQGVSCGNTHSRVNSLSLWGNCKNCARNTSLIVKPKANGSSFGASLSNLTALTQLTFVNIQVRFRFSIPHAIFTLTNLVSLLLTDSQFSGPTIPADVGKLVKLTELFLTGNRFPGGLPDSIGNLKNLNSLSLENNQMTSIGSTRITLLKELDYVDLAHNKLSGPIPKWLGRITLTGAANGALNLMFNQFTGSFPGELCNIKPKLLGLWLDYNKLSGPIPAAIGNCTQLWTLSVVDNELSGPLPHELGNLKNLQNFFVPNNQLTGPLPKELGNLDNFNQMDISHNKITGAIPSNYGRTFEPDFDTVDFTYNMLTSNEKLWTHLDVP